MRKLERLGPMSSYIVLVAVYFLLVALLPANKTAMSTYHLTSSSYHILLFVVEVPLAAMWLAAFYGYFKLRQYVAAIARTAEEGGFNRLAMGFQWLAWSLVLPPLLSMVLNGIANTHPGFHPTAIIVSNYLSLIFPLIAFTLMSSGSDMLLTRGRWNRSVTRHLKPILLLFSLLAAVYCFLMFRSVDMSQPGASQNPYFLPTWLLLTTIVVPYLYTWFVGLITAYEIGTLAKHARGVLYRQGLGLLASGVALVIASSVGAQYLTTIMPRTGHLTLNTVLVIIYVFYVVIILGFILIGMGASRLKKIEDI